MYADIKCISDAPATPVPWKARLMDETFAERIARLMDEHTPPIGVRQLARMVDRTPGAVSNWRNGRGVPKEDDVIFKICQIFGVSKEYLMGSTETRDGSMTRSEELESIVKGLLEELRREGLRDSIDDATQARLIRLIFERMSSSRAPVTDSAIRDAIALYTSLIKPKKD